MLEDYLKLKETYPKSIALIKAGNFYECLNDDAIVMNNIFGYKIKKLHKYIRVGFPISSLNKITSKLREKEINYIIIIDGVLTKEKFNHNKYNDYLVVDDKKNDDYDSALNKTLALKKIKLINQDLINNINNSKIIDILNEIEKVICKISL